MSQRSWGSLLKLLSSLQPQTLPVRNKKVRTRKISNLMDLLWLVAHTTQEFPNSMKYLQLSDAEKQEKPSRVRPSVELRRALTERRGRSDVIIIIITINDIISISFIIIISWSLVQKGQSNNQSPHQSSLLSVLRLIDCQYLCHPEEQPQPAQSILNYSTIVHTLCSDFLTCHLWATLFWGCRYPISVTLPTFECLDLCMTLWDPVIVQLIERQALTLTEEMQLQ